MTLTRKRKSIEEICDGDIREVYSGRFSLEMQWWWQVNVVKGEVIAIIMIAVRVVKRPKNMQVSSVECSSDEICNK